MKLIRKEQLFAYVQNSLSRFLGFKLCCHSQMLEKETEFNKVTVNRVQMPMQVGSM